MAKSIVIQVIISIITIILTMLLLVAAFINPRFDDLQDSIGRVNTHIDNHIQSKIISLEGNVDNLEDRMLKAHFERKALAGMITALANGKDAETIAAIWDVVSSGENDA